MGIEADEAFMWALFIEALFYGTLVVRHQFISIDADSA
jgi:hypothetical protein